MMAVVPYARSSLIHFVTIPIYLQYARHVGTVFELEEERYVMMGTQEMELDVNLIV